MPLFCVDFGLGGSVLPKGVFFFNFCERVCSSSITEPQSDSVTLTREDDAHPVTDGAKRMTRKPNVLFAKGWNVKNI